MTAKFSAIDASLSALPFEAAVAQPSLEQEMAQIVAERSTVPELSDLIELGETACKQNQQPAQTSSARNQGFEAFVSTFVTTFITIFLAELGDKTQLTTLLISAESQSPWVVFIGSASALITTSLLGVLLGRWLAQRLSPKTLETAAGIILLCVSVLLLWDVVQL